MASRPATLWMRSRLRREWLLELVASTSRTTYVTRCRLVDLARAKDSEHGALGDPDAIGDLTRREMFRRVQRHDLFGEKVWDVDRARHRQAF